MNKAQSLIELCKVKNLKITTAESCTGGLVAKTITDCSGSSRVFGHGFVTYSNKAKAEMLGVNLEHILRYGAVSEVVATSMAKGAITKSKADISISITGIAGPSGGSPEKPVGLVFFATANKKGNVIVKEKNFTGSRSQIRSKAKAYAVNMLIKMVKEF